MEVHLNSYIVTISNINVKDRWGTGVILNHLSVPASSSHQIHLALFGMELHGEHRWIFPTFLSELFCTYLCWNPLSLQFSDSWHNYVQSKRRYLCSRELLENNSCPTKDTQVFCNYFTSMGLKCKFRCLSITSCHSSVSCVNLVKLRHHVSKITKRPFFQ